MNVRALRRKVRAPFEYIGAAALMRWGGLVPQPVLETGAAVVGRMQAYVPGKRRVMAANLEIAFPSLDMHARLAIARRSCVHVLRTLGEVLHFARNPEWLRERLDLNAPGWEEVRKRAGNGPCIFITPHLGNWELVAQGAVLNGIPMCAVARPIRNPKVDALVSRVRSRIGLQVVPAQGAVRKLSRALRSGCHVGVVMDQNVRPRNGGIFVDFFGLPAATTPAPAALARRFDADILCAALIRTADGYRLAVASLPKPARAYDDSQTLTAEIMHCLEALIRRYPEQYVWHYERWRYIPSGIAPEIRARFPFYAREVDTPL